MELQPLPKESCPSWHPITQRTTNVEKHHPLRAGQNGCQPHSQDLHFGGPFGDRA